MGILADDIAKVRSSADLVALIGEHTSIKRAGRNWMARCPLHGERTPSLSVNAEKGVYYCFGCQRSGDAITFVQEIESLEFVAAVESLAARYGISLHYTSKNETKQRARSTQLREAVANAVEYYHQCLLNDDEAGPARGYLRARGYDRKVVRKYMLGWAPNSRDALARHLKLNRDDLRDSGLGNATEAGMRFDAFQGRIMFPISDERGRYVGFGGRDLPDGGGPKYINTSGRSLIYEKSKVLYGLHTHRASIVKASEAIICEGYTDVIGFGCADILRAVATCGTALTEEHIQLLKRFSVENLILAFDTDSAGLAAAERVYEWEQKYELNVRVAELTAGFDPADLAQKDPATLVKAVKNAKPYLRFRMQRALAGKDLSSPETRARAAQRAAAVVCEHPSELVRDPYLIEIADMCRVEINTLRDFARQLEAKQPIKHVKPKKFTPEPAIAAEDEAIRLLIHYPNYTSRLHANLFAHSVRQETFQALADHGFSAALEQAGEQVATLLRRLAVEDFEADVDDVFAGLIRLAGRRTLDGMLAGMRDYSDAAKQQLSQALEWLQRELHKLNDDTTRGVAIESLTPWLIRNGHWRPN